MTGPILLLCLISACFMAVHAVFGYEIAYLVGYGSFTLMAALISATFLWLWARRATPLALGMSFGWGGAASVMGWWWIFNLNGQLGWMGEHPMLFGFLSLYFVGALLHLQVIGRSFELPARTPLVAFVGTLAASAVVAVLVRAIP